MMRGIYKGFKYITHIFVVKEEEIQIGLPTDVKHVAHIGLDGPSGSAPTWMNEFKAAPEFSSSLSESPNSESAKTTKRDDASSVPVGAEASEGEVSSRDVVVPSDIPKVRKKQRRKKTKSASSPKATSSPTTVSRPSRPKKSKVKKTTDNGDDYKLLCSEEDLPLN